MPDAQPNTTTNNAPNAQPTDTPAAPTQIPPTRVEVDPNAQPQVTQPKPDPNRPTWLPPKFKSAEDLAKAYGELEKRLGGKPAEPKPADPATPPAKPGDLSIEAAEKAAEAKGLDLAPFQDEFAKDGKLSDESYEKLTKAGIPKQMVDDYIAGQQARAQQSAEGMLKAVGLDMDGYTKMAQWAAANVPKAELEAYNKIVTGQDPAAAQIALQGLQARFKSAQEPGFFRQGEQPDQRGDVFRSTAEITEAINNPKYKNDPAYRRDVEQKIMRSNII